MFQDEVDLNLNPDIGCMWMPRGEQAEVVTPGTNVKRYLCGVDELAERRAGRDPGHAPQRRAVRARTWTTCGGGSATTG